MRFAQTLKSYLTKLLQPTGSNTMADVTIYKPADVQITVIDGPPPVDQSAEVATLQAQVASLTADKASLTDQVASLTAANTSLTAANASLNEQMTSLTAANAALSAKIAKALADLA